MFKAQFELPFLASNSTVQISLYVDIKKLKLSINSCTFSKEFYCYIKLKSMCKLFFNNWP